jgi:hypothetical protein
VRWRLLLRKLDGLEDYFLALKVIIHFSDGLSQFNSCIRLQKSSFSPILTIFPLQTSNAFHIRQIEPVWVLGASHISSTSKLSLDVST